MLQKNNLNITIVGLGYVGIIQAVGLNYLGYKTKCYDINSKRIDCYNHGQIDIFEEGLIEQLSNSIKNNLIEFTDSTTDAYKNADIIFVCVNTPENEDGSSNLNYLNSAITDIKQNITKDCILVIKSTVPLQTGVKLQNEFKDFKYNVSVVSNPEFLSQGTALKDFLNPQRIVIGGTNSCAVKTIQSLYTKLNAPFVLTTNTNAEMIKYASNSFLALKISFINDIANICEKVGANINDVTKGMKLDSRIGNKYLKEGLGFGGSCLIKDTMSLSHTAIQNGYSPQTLISALETNEKQIYKFLTMLKNQNQDIKGKTIAVLGLAFKKNSDDLRHSIAVKNIDKMLKMGANVKVYDPKAMTKLNYTNVTKCTTIKECLTDANYCFVFTDWDEFSNLTEQDFIQTMQNPVVFDGRNCLTHLKQSANVTYYGIGV